MQFHRLAALILGLWLGASVFMDVVATQNFRTVARVMANPDLKAIEDTKAAGGKEAVIALLRHAAGESNRYLFEQWEWAELLLGLALFLVLLFGRTYQKVAMAIVLMMLAIVVGQRFVLTPTLTKIGRDLEAAGSAPGRRFAYYHQAYGYSEIGKLILGLVIGFRLVIRKKADSKAFARQYETSGMAR